MAPPAQDNNAHSGNVRRPQQYFLNILIISIASTMMLAMVSYLFLESKEPSSPRMNTSNQVAGHYLRNYDTNNDRHLFSHLIPSHSLLSGTDEFFSYPNPKEKDSFDPYENLVPSMVWEDGFFAPLLESPLLHELQKEQKQYWIDPKYDMKEDSDHVSLTVSVPDIPLNDINIEVIGGRIVHIHGEKKTESSHVTFDKKFSIGKNLDETNLQAKMTKNGALVVTAPKAKLYNQKEDTRKIPIVTVEEL